MYTKAKFLKLVISNGYDGDPELDKIKAWAKKNGIEFKDEDGEDLDLDAIWKQKTVLKAVADDGEGDTDDAGGEGEEDAGRKGKKSKKSKANASDDEDEDDDDDEGDAGGGSAGPKRYVPGQGYRNGPGRVDATEGKAGRLENIWARKQYNYKAKHGHSVFADADMAENFAATYRLGAAAACMRHDYALKARDLEIVGKAGSTTTDSNAGVLVSPEIDNTLLWLTEQYGVAGKTADVVPMMSGEKWSRRKTAIFSMSHQNENGSFTATNNSYDMVKLTAKKVGALIQDSNEVLEDSDINRADDYARTFAEAQAYREDLDYFLGDGSSTYGGNVGLIGASWMTFVDATGSTWDAIVENDFLLMIGAVENIDPKRLEFRCSRQFFVQVIMHIANAKGGTTPQAILNGVPPFGSGEPDAWAWGFPVRFVQVMPTATATSQKCCYFGDFQGASKIGRRKGLEIKTSKDYAFNADQLTFLGISRIAINVHGDGRGSTTGPVIGMKTS